MKFITSLFAAVALTTAPAQASIEQATWFINNSTKLMHQAKSSLDQGNTQAACGYTRQAKASIDAAYNLMPLSAVANTQGAIRDILLKNC